MKEFFQFEGEELRIQGGADDSGVREAGKTNYRKWVLSHRINRRWIRDAYILLPNDADIEDAKKLLGFKGDGQ